jgi:hypothetical protein
MWGPVEPWPARAERREDDKVIPARAAETDAEFAARAIEFEQRQVATHAHCIATAEQRAREEQSPLRGEAWRAADPLTRGKASLR